MKKGLRLFGHPLHPMWIVFPLGLFPVAAVFDIIYLVTHSGHWADMSYWIIAAGIIGSLIAAVFGFVDWLALPSGTRAVSVGIFHGLTNFIVVVLFIVSWLLRQPNPTMPGLLPIILCFIGVALALFGGWLGGELVYRMSAWVDEGAHLDSPNSLSGRPASERASGTGFV